MPEISTAIQENQATTPIEFTDPPFEDLFPHYQELLETIPPYAREDLGESRFATILQRVLETPLTQRYTPLLPQLEKAAPKIQHAVSVAISNYTGGALALGLEAATKAMISELRRDTILAIDARYPRYTEHLLYLKTLLTSNSTAGFAADLPIFVNQSRTNQPFMYEGYDTHTLLPLIDFVCQLDDMSLKHPTAVLLSGIKHSDLSESAQEHLKCELFQHQLDLTPYVYRWWLCAHAEQYFLEAITDHSWVHANTLFIKSYGRLTALCTKNMVTTNGTVLLAGEFYSPVTSSLRNSLRGDLGSNRTTASAVQGTWTPVRSMRDAFSYPYHVSDPHYAYYTYDELLHMLDEMIETSGPWHETSRKTYSASEILDYEEEPDDAYEQNFN